ncbi:MAG: hypothetical protein HOC91_16535 [Nitrospinaceae bacterium]|nr:hypothetical protein [Nitrospinaceae bacterium]MBT4095383.1 hypothetical protein [Nitrospinaceae bacterium]MBT4432118.1 hypothetical protein [Nitrospinaceae bacterium]MBT5948379.1 hypothetical protein [Nitrospinaceae bacterium]
MSAPTASNLQFFITQMAFQNPCASSGYESYSGTTGSSRIIYSEPLRFAFATA